jgi:hypothetical protein
VVLVDYQQTRYKASDMAVEWMQSILQQALGKSYRSTALTSLGWLMSILGTIWLGSLAAHASPIERGAIEVLLVVSFFAYLWAYVFFARTNPDALRSEKFTIQKMAIEKSIKGDNLGGFLELEGELPAKPLPPSTQIVEGQR